MTENEAKQKWCPMVGEDGGSEVGEDGGSDRCIASNCMMWRWDLGKPPPTELTIGHGYCGLAGKQ